MYPAHLLPTDGLANRANEFQTTNGFLSCALSVIHLHKDFVDVREYKNELDGYIAQAYLKQVIKELILRATQWLSSPSPFRQKRGSRLVELVDDKELDQHPEYKAYRHLLLMIVGEAPIMRLHLQALELVATQSRTVRSTCKKATVTESILENFADLNSGFDISLSYCCSALVG